MRKKSIPKQIADLVKDKDLNSEEIADIIKLKEDPEENRKHVRTYINRAMKEELITIVRKEGRLNYYGELVDDSVRIHEMELKRLHEESDISFYTQKYLRELYALMEDSDKCRIYNEKLTEKDNELMKDIKKLFKDLKRRKELRFEFDEKEFVRTKIIGTK